MFPFVITTSVCHEVDTWVEVSHAHRARLVVSRCTIYTVALVISNQPTVFLVDARRCFLMRTLVVPAIGQHLSEVEVVVRPDRIVLRLRRRSVGTLLTRVWNDTFRIAEVTIAVAVFHIAIVLIGRSVTS